MAFGLPIHILDLRRLFGGTEAKLVDGGGSLFLRCSRLHLLGAYLSGRRKVLARQIQDGVLLVGVRYTLHTVSLLSQNPLLNLLGLVQFDFDDICARLSLGVLLVDESVFDLHHFFEFLDLLRRDQRCPIDDEVLFDGVENDDSL